MNLPRSSDPTAVSLRLLGAALLLALFLPTAGPATAQEPLAEVENFGDALVFNPVNEFGRLILTVTGPCDFRFRQEVTQGQLMFRLDATTIDGAYTYDLVRLESVDPGIVKVLQEARKNLDEETPRQLCRDGKLPAAPISQSEGFLVSRGEIVYDPSAIEKSAGLRSLTRASGSEGLVSVAAGSDSGELRNVAAADFVIIDDLIVDGSACIGFDCVNGESFGFDTLRLKENNLRIKFDDTSTAASFPRNDWQLTANDSANGGASKFSIDDISGGRTPFTVEANARSHSLYVDDGGRIGSRTSTPSTEIHTVDGDTPTLRLQQDGSSGFAPQTWDVAGNETSFFIRDVTNGSQLPFRIRPGADSNSLVIDADNDVGIGVLSPTAKLHLLENGLVRYRLENSSAGTQWDATNDGNGDFGISLVGSGGNELEIEQDGDIGNCGNPDHDFVISTGPGCTATPRSWIDAGDPGFTTTSSRTFKENLEAVEMPEILDRIREIPVYKYDFVDGPENRIGLMAEDFHEIFHRGSDKELSGYEMQVAMWLAIQELDARHQKLIEQNNQLRQEIEKLKSAE